MILTVTLDATLHVSYEAPEISWGAPNHIRQLISRAGGGGLAVARVLAGLGEDVLAAGFAGGGAARVIEADLARAGVATAFTPIGRESRRVVAVLDEAREQTTWLAEPAPFITTGELGRFAGEYRKLLPGVEAVILSGGLPAGLPGDVYASLTSYATEAGVPAIVHAGGPALWPSLARHPALVLDVSTPGPPGAGPPGAGPPGAGPPGAGPPGAGPPGAGLPARPDGLVARPDGLVARGAAAAAMVCGAGLLTAAGSGRWQAALDASPGLSLSGEAVVAGLLPAVARDWAWPDALRHAVALGAAADPAGEVDLDAYEMFSSEVSVTGGA